MRKQWQKILVAFPIFIVINTCLITAIDGETPNDRLDQQQIQASNVEFIHSEIHVAQSFKPTLPKLTRIKLYLSKQGDIASEIILTIKDSPTGSTLVQTSMPSENIPANSQEWVEFDFPDMDVNLGKRYYIICETNSGDQDNCYKWYGSNMNNYEYGIKYVSTNNGTTWNQKSQSDCTFKTYGGGAILEINYVVGGFGNQIEIGIANNGTAQTSDINIQANFNRGLLLKRQYTQTINTTLAPGEEIHGLIYPVIGLGPTTITLYVWSENVETVQKTKYAFLLLFYIYIEP